MSDGTDEREVVGPQMIDPASRRIASLERELALQRAVVQELADELISFQLAMAKHAHTTGPLRDGRGVGIPVAGLRRIARRLRPTT